MRRFRPSWPCPTSCAAAAVARLVARLGRDDSLEPAAEALEWADARALTDEQRRIYDAVAGGARLTLVCAPGGTGKTHTAAVLARRATSVLCLAPTWKAISVLRGKLEGDDVTFLTVQGFVLQASPPDADLVVVDETSMLTMGVLRRILAQYERKATRLVFLGDDAQLPCIGVGAPLRDLQTMTETLRLTRCLRTDGVALAAAADAVRRGAPIPYAPGEVVPLDDVFAAIPTLLAGGGGQEEGERGEGREEAPLHVRMPWEPGYVQFVTPQNRDVALLNEAVQERLTGKGARFSGCYEGDAVRICENTDEYKNGDEGQLMRVESRKRPRASKATRVGVVRLKGGRLVRVADYHMAPAYATTVHKVQGSEYARAVVALFDGTHPNLLTRESVYTSVTRAKEVLYVAASDALLARCAPLVRRTVARA